MNRISKFSLTVVTLFLLTSLGMNAQTTWYTNASGKWKDPNIWTLDPSGAVHQNPSNLYPNLATDNIIIRTGKTVTVQNTDGSNLNNLNCSSLKVDGTLDFGTTTGHTFTYIKGSGRIYLAADNFPAGDASNFITKGLGEGTVVLKGTSISMTNARTFYNLEIAMTSSSNIATLTNNITLNGNLAIKTGTLQINSATARTLSVAGNITIDAGATFNVGTSNAFHWLNVYGDFTNNGTVNFSNSAQYSEPNNGAIKLKFLGATNNNLVCNNTTNLYRLFIDKGTDKTYYLAVNASAAANFKLYGPVTGVSTDATDGSAGYQRLPIVLVNGTLKLESNISITRLSNNTTPNGVFPYEFTVPSTTQLWINGATVISSSSTGSNCGITIYGKLKVSAGTLTLPASTNGIRYATDGVVTPELEVTGGTIYTTELRNYNSSTKFSFTQSGGAIYFNATATDYWSSPVFQLDQTTHSFEMSGGTMTFSVANNNNVSGIYINCASGNYNVTGGTVEIQTPSTYDFKICSTAPFYNLTTTATASAKKIIMTNLYGGADINFYGDLKVLNNLTIGASTTFDASIYKLSVGKDLSVASGATFTQTTGSTAQLKFVGATNSTFTNSNATALNISDLVIEKDIYSPSTSFYSVTLAGSTGGFTINDSLLVKRGKLDVVNFNVNLKNSMEIVDGDMTSSGTGSIILSGTTKQTIKGASGVVQNFGKLQLNNTYGTAPQIQLLSNVTAKDVTFTASSQVFDLSTYNLSLTAGNYSAWGWGTSSTKYFKTAGTASSGGLTLPVTAASYSGAMIQLFPIATAGGYSPVAVYATGSVSSGTITIKPVNDYHPTVSNSSRVSQYYWKISHTIPSGSASNLRYTMYCPATVKSSYNALLVLNGTTWANDSGTESSNTLTYNPGYSSSNYISGDFTVGNQSGFNSPRVLYSITSGSFSNKNTWSTTSHTGSATNQAPNAYDYLIIGGASGVNHTVTINANNADASQVYIKGVSETGISGTPPTLYVNHGTSGHDIDLIKGKGRIVFENNTTWYSSYVIINGDYSEFCNNSEAIMEFTGTQNQTRVLPVTSLIPYYPNLYIKGTSGTTLLSWGDELKVNGNLLVDGPTFDIKGISNGIVSVSGNVTINTGTLKFAEAYNNQMTVYGDIIFTGTGSFSSNASNKQLSLYGNITLGNGNIDFSTNTVDIKFIGNNSATVSRTGSGTTNFYRLFINKPTGQKVYFTTPFNLGGPTNDATKSLVLQTGECHLSNSSINLTLSTSGNAFKIPTGTILRVDNGSTVKVGSSSGNTGIWLDGSLIIDNAGKVYCNQGSGSYTDNYLEYTPSGNASIYLGTDAELIVGSQLRRTTSSDEGVLLFTQAKSSSIVTVGTQSAPTNNRGVFEVLNTGSSFTQSESGCNITIVRQQTTPSVPALNFNPATSSIATGAGFTIGNASTPPSQTIGVYAGQNLMNLTLNSTNSPNLKIWTGAMTIDGNLAINGGTFDANGYALTLKGNLTNSGTFTANGNTTYIIGSNDQTITGNTTFYNLTKQSTANSLILGGTTSLTVNNTLDIETGTINTGTNNISVKGDLINNGTTLSTGASTGITMNGTSAQELSGSGTFARLTINNSNGITVPTQSGSLNFTDALRLQSGIFDIGRNLIVFGTNASITPVNAFSSTNMIQTNLSFTDNGIKKAFPVIASSTSFTFPIGSSSKYTPVIFDITSNTTAGGAIRVKAANERHVSISNLSTTTYDDTQNVLQYNWTLDATGVTGFTATATMQGYLSDALVTAPNTLTDYITARILMSSTDWNKFTNTDYNESTGALTFRFSGTNDIGIDGDYTAGISAAIPDQVPSYITVADGPWTTTTTWATYNPTTQAIGVAGVNIPAGGPNGSVIYVANTLTMPSNFMAAYRTHINASGVLSVGTSIGHRLGDVYGTGKMLLQNGDLPAGVYDNFFSTSGGTLEFTGTTDYSILSEITAVNHLILSGTGARKFPNLDFSVLGNFTINGATVVNEFSKTATFDGNITFTSGNYQANTGTWKLAGTTLQTLSGAVNFTSSNALYNLIVNSDLRADVTNSYEVTNQLTLTKGILNTGAGGSLTITNSLPEAFTGGSSTSYVDGPLRKTINNSSYFEFPLGDQSRYGRIKVSPNSTSGGIWEAEYHNNNPATDGYNPNSFYGGVAYVSHNEYWRVKAPVANNAAILTMYWDASSGVNPNSDFRVVKWTDLVTDAWGSIAIDSPSGTSSSGNVSISSVLSFGFSASNNNHYVTFGSITVPSYTWTGAVSTDWFTTGNWSNSIIPSASSNVTIANVTNKPTISGSIVAQTNNLTINSSAQLTLAAGGKLTVNGNITNNGSLILEHTSAAPSSFLYHGTTSAGSVTVKQEFIEARNKWYVGHALNETTYKDYVDGSLLIDSDPTHVAVYQYNTIVDGSDSWVRITNQATDLGVVMKGYNVQFYNPNVTVSQTGTLWSNTLPLSINLNKAGYQVVANPYPCYVDLNDYANTWDFSQCAKSVWLYTNYNGQRVFGTYNLVTGVGIALDRYLAPLQGFFVQANTDNVSFGIKPSARLIGNGSALKTATVSHNDVLRLQVANSITKDETVVVFRNIGYDLFDSEIDSEKKMDSNGNVPFIYSIKSNKNVAINIMPEDPTSYTIPLAMTVGAKGAGSMTLNASNISDFLPSVSVYLRDLATGTVTDLRQSPSYTFTTAAVSAQNRFELFFKKTSEQATSTDVSEAVETFSINAFGIGNKAIITITDNTFNGNAIIDLYDATGKLISNQTSAAKRTEIEMTDNTQMVIVKVTYKKQLKSFKIMKSLGL